MKDTGEENLGNHDSSLAERGPHSSAPHWEEGREVIPTFFSTMNTRYAALADSTGSWVPVSLPENPSWSSVQGMVVTQVSSVLSPLFGAAVRKELGCESMLFEQLLAGFSGLSLENDCIRLYHNRKAITGSISEKSGQITCPVQSGAAVFMTTLNCMECWCYIFFLSSFLSPNCLALVTLNFWKIVAFPQNHSWHHVTPWFQYWVRLWDCCIHFKFLSRHTRSDCSCFAVEISRTVGTVR